MEPISDSFRRKEFKILGKFSWKHLSLSRFLVKLSSLSLFVNGCLRESLEGKPDRAKCIKDHPVLIYFQLSFWQKLWIQKMYIHIPNQQIRYVFSWKVNRELQRRSKPVTRLVFACWYLYCCFEHVSHLALVILLLTLNIAGKWKYNNSCVKQCCIALYEILQSHQI